MSTENVHSTIFFSATPADNEADIALYIGVFVAVVFFIMFFIAMVMFIRRIKGRDPCMYRGNGTGKNQPNFSNILVFIKVFYIIV